MGKARRERTSGKAVHPEGADRPDTAERAAHDIEAQAAALDKYAVLMSVLRIPRPLRRVRAQAVGQDAQVAVEVEGRAIAMLMARSKELTGEMFE